MSFTLEDMIGITEVIWVLIFNPVAWIVVTGLALKGVRLRYLIPSGVLAYFCSIVVLSIYSVGEVTEVILSFEWLAMIVPTSVVAGAIIAFLVFYLLKLREKGRQTNRVETPG